jgi:hypothetical protein
MRSEDHLRRVAPHYPAHREFAAAFIAKGR